MIPSVHPAYGPLHALEVYLDWDGPKLLSAVDDIGNLFWLHWIDDAPGYDRWWVTRVVRQRLEAVRSGRLDFANLVLEPTDTLFILEDTPEGVQGSPVSLETVDASLLPLPGDRIRCDMQLDDLLHDHARRSLAARLGEDVLDFQLSGPSVDDHKIGFVSLARMLHNTNDLLKALSVQSGTPYDAQVHATPPGSFMVRVSGGSFSLGYATKATAGAASGDHAQLRGAFPTEPARAAFLKFINALVEEDLGVSIFRADSHGLTESALLPKSRLLELRDYMRVTVPQTIEAEVAGILDTVSESQRLLTILTPNQEAVRVRVPKDLIGALAGLQARRRYRCRVARHSLVNLFKDEQDIEYELRETPQALDEQLPEPPHLEAADQSRPAPGYQPEQVVRRWAKVLSRTDAHETLPSGFPYLRMSRGLNRMGMDPADFFLYELFGPALGWEQRKWGKRATSVGETGHFEAFVQLFELPAFRKVLAVSVDPERQQPAWIHWDTQMKELLRAANLAGSWVTVERTSTDEFWIRFLHSPPEWLGKPQPE